MSGTVTNTYSEITKTLGPDALCASDSRDAAQAAGKTAKQSGVPTVSLLAMYDNRSRLLAAKKDRTQ